MNPEIDDAHKYKVGDHVVNSPVSINIGDVVTKKPDPLNVGTHVISSSSIKCCDEFATVDGGLENLENPRVEKQPNLVSPKYIDGLRIAKKSQDVSTQKLERLVEVCCGKSDSKEKGSMLLSTRRFTRSMAAPPFQLQFL